MALGGPFGGFCRWGQARLRGLEGARTWCGWGVLSHNAIKMPPNSAGTSSPEPDRTRSNSGTQPDRPNAREITLFADRGPSLVDVRRRGIAAPTVYAVFCNKAEIIKELVSRLEAEADGEQWRARIGAEPDPRRKLDLYAAWHRILFSRGRDVLGAAIDAGGDPGVRDLREEGDRSNQAWLGPVVDALVEAGLLAPGLTRQNAADSTSTARSS